LGGGTGAAEDWAGVSCCGGGKGGRGLASCYFDELDGDFAGVHFCCLCGFWVGGLGLWGVGVSVWEFRKSLWAVSAKARLCRSIFLGAGLGLEFVTVL